MNNIISEMNIIISEVKNTLKEIEAGDRIEMRKS